jgi:translation initiation factor IF-3
MVRCAGCPDQEHPVFRVQAAGKTGKREGGKVAIQSPRVNRRIRIPQVRVINDDGEQLGVLPTSEALAMAEERGLDLVEVSPKARPPVCKIMDYGKYMYQLNKRAKEARKRQHVTVVKEVKMRPKIEPHDYDFKLRHAREFLGEGDKVKVTVNFRGRELAHKDLGRRLMERAVEDLADVANVEVAIRSEGRSMIMVLAPKPTSKKKDMESKDREKKEQEKTPNAEDQDTQRGGEEVQAD